MVRGRKKDLTVPPTRQLTLQRDYRARKAQYLAELEERCSRAEEENARLRRELQLARAAIPFASPREVAQVSSELLRDLANASASIARFQEITAPQGLAPASDDNSSHYRQLPKPSCSLSVAGSTDLCPLSPPHQTSPSQPVSLPSLRVHALHEPPARLSPPAPVLFPTRGPPMDQTTPSPASPQPSTRSSPSLESSCCGGYIDCASECCGGYFDCADLLGEKGQGNQYSGGNFLISRTSRNLAN